MQRLQDHQNTQVHKPFNKGSQQRNSRVIKMSEFNEDDMDIEDEEDGEHMT